MEVSVQVHGSLRGALATRAHDLSLPESATAGDLIAQLGARLGAPFATAAASPDPRLPREIRVFVGGELLVSRAQPLARSGAAAPVNVVLLTPVAGG
jgi:molybdopterin converting factor small subunit